MAKEGTMNISAIVVLISGVVMLLYSFYYIQQLSYSIGVYSGIASTIRSYNITANTSANNLLASITQSTTLLFALHISYILLPLAILIFGIGVIWLFTRSNIKYTSMILMMSSIICIILVAILEFDFNFTGLLSVFPVAYIGSAMALVCGAYPFLKSDYRPQLAKRPVHPIRIDPNTPYSNMKTISVKLMGKLSGDIRILDMHFDVAALDNLMQLIDKNSSRYKSIMVLTKADRLGSDFENSYRDFKSELANRHLGFELRVLDQQKASQQHERLLIDESTAYKIPPFNIINRKSDHIIGINFKEAQQRFNDLWSEATKFENMKPI